MDLTLSVSPSVQDAQLNSLFTRAWPNRRDTDQRVLLNCALFYVCAYSGEQLVGFAKVVCDGGQHGFLLDPTVAPELQRKGIGRQLVTKCADEALKRGIRWLHVDFEPHLKPFYQCCGFRHTEAGLQDLQAGPNNPTAISRGSGAA